jgi:hypothetical protein
VKKKSPRKSIFKSFVPVDSVQIDTFKEEHKSSDIEESFGYFVFSSKREKLFLNRFSGKDLFDIIEKVGMISHLRDMGFDRLKISIDRDESLIHYMKIFNGEESPESMLVDLRVSESRFVPDMRFFPDGMDTITYDMIVIEWLSAQNPGNAFTSSRPQLPGQKRPGLGCLNYLMDTMYVVGREIIKDGFMDIPDHMHGAIMYSRKFKFFDPAHEAVLKAILRDTSSRSLIDVSWGMITETIIDEATGLPVKYDPSEQIFPMSGRIKKYFNSSSYLDRYKNIYKKKKYLFEFEKMREARDRIIKSKDVADL